MLQKGPGYHLDLFILAFLIMICSFLGLPWFVAATVRTVTHIRSLIRVSELRAPGERSQMLGVRLAYCNFRCQIKIFLSSLPALYCDCFGLLRCAIAFLPQGATSHRTVYTFVDSSFCSAYEYPTGEYWSIFLH